MKNLIKINKNIILFLFLLFNSCVSEKNDIYEKFPKNTLLNFELVIQSDAIIKTDIGFILMYNMREKYSEEYNPHLLFFDNKKKLVSACYFLSENVFNYENKIITAYLNKNREHRKSIYRNDIPKDIRIRYKKYETEYPHGPSIEKGILGNIEYNKQNSTVDFKLKDSVNHLKSYKSIPLYKLTYDFDKEKIVINNTHKDKIREREIFKVSKIQLTRFFYDVLDERKRKDINR